VPEELQRLPGLAHRFLQFRRTAALGHDPDHLGAHDDDGIDVFEAARRNRKGLRHETCLLLVMVTLRRELLKSKALAKYQGAKFRHEEPSKFREPGVPFRE
jgi:hypothetical protein